MGYKLVNRYNKIICIHDIVNGIPGVKIIFFSRLFRFGTSSQAKYSYLISLFIGNQIVSGMHVRHKCWIVSNNSAIN